MFSNQSDIDQQLKHNDCGISAVKTIFNIHKMDIDRKYIQQSIFMDDKGSRISDIKKFFDSNGFETNFKLLDIHYIQGKVSMLDSLLPCILPVNTDEGLHYVVIHRTRGHRLRILDPSRAKQYYLTIPELKKAAYFTENYWDLVDVQERLDLICSEELNKYHIALDQVLPVNENGSLFNKLTYFTYLKENFGFKDHDAEKRFLEDLLLNQDIAVLPRYFRSLKYEQEKVKIEAPLILSVKPKKERPPVAEVAEDKKQNVYLILFNKLGSYKKMWYIYLFAALFASATTQVAVFINQILIDHILPSYQVNTLLLFAIGIGIFKLFELFTSLYKSFVGIHIGNIFDKYFLAAFDQKLNDFSMPYIQSFKKGDLTERLSDALKLKSFFLKYFTNILVDTSVSISSLVILFYLNWKLTLVVCMVILLFYAWFKIITPYLKINERKRFIKKADFFSRMLEKIEGIQVIKSFNIEKVHSRKVFASISDLLNLQLKTKYIDLVNLSVISVISITASLFILIFLSKTAMQGAVITLGQIITFIMLTERIFDSLSSLLEQNLSLQENEVILRRYLDFEDKPVPLYAKGIEQFEIDHLSAQNLCFGYFPSDKVINNLSFVISKGEKIKITGLNGSGKSTLSKLLTFLYPPVSGELYINDLKSTFYDVQALKKKILLVTNEDILFNDTLAFNISFGREISTRKTLELAKAIRIYDFIASREEGLNFLISENGRNLSTGQRKKILLLRALLSDAEVIILDEVLSGMDNESRSYVETLINNIRDKTFILISHEPIININFNKIYKLVNGELILQ